MKDRAKTGVLAMALGAELIAGWIVGGAGDPEEGRSSARHNSKSSLHPGRGPVGAKVPAVVRAKAARVSAAVGVEDKTRAVIKLTNNIPTNQIKH